MRPRNMTFREVREEVRLIMQERQSRGRRPAGAFPLNPGPTTPLDTQAQLHQISRTSEDVLKLVRGISDKQDITERKLSSLEERVVALENTRRAGPAPQPIRHESRCWQCGQPGHWRSNCPLGQLPNRRDVTSGRTDAHASRQSFKLGGPAPGVGNSAGNQRMDPNPPHDLNHGNFSVIGPSNVDTVFVNGRPCQTLIDSGSQVTTVSASFVESHPTLSRITPEPSPVSINGAGGHTLPHIGVIPIEIKCQGRVYINVPALIVPSNSYGPGVDALVGTNLIRVFQRDERRTRGDTYLSRLKKQNNAWYTACAAMDAALPGTGLARLAC